LIFIGYPLGAGITDILTEPPEACIIAGFP